MLKTDRDAFVQGLSEKLLIYALGRGLERTDRPAIANIAESLPTENYRFSKLVMGVVTSLPFQNRRPSIPGQLAATMEGKAK